MSLPTYPYYKETGLHWLGEVPAHWMIKRFRFVANLNPSRSEVAGLDPSIEVSFLPMESIGDDGSLKLDRSRRLAEVESGYTFFRDGDVTIAKITPCFENGKGALMQGLRGGIGFGTTELFVVRPKKGHALGSLLNWLFRSPGFRKQGEASMYGAGGQKRVSDTFLRDFKWAFPPLDEQSAIAAFLDRETAKIDALIAQQAKLIALLAEKRQATISHAVMHGLDRDVPMKDASMGTVPAHWEVGPLKRYWSVTDCKHVTAEFVEDGFPLASIREVQSTYVSLSEAKRTTRHFFEQLIEGGRKPVAGDLIFSRNATVGEVGQVTDEHPAFAMGQDVCLLRRISPAYSAPYLQAVIRSPVVVEQLKNLMIGSTFKRVNVEEIRSLVIPMPPAQEQTQIARFVEAEVSKLDMLTANAVRGIELLKERRSALITAAVTGQIDVRNAVPHPAAEPQPLAA